MGEKIYGTKTLRFVMSFLGLLCHFVRGGRGEFGRVDLPLSAHFFSLNVLHQFLSRPSNPFKCFHLENSKSLKFLAFLRKCFEKILGNLTWSDV